MVTSNGVDTLKLVARDRGGLYGGRVTSLELPSLGQTSTGARFLAASDDGSELFVSRAGTGTVILIDVADGTPVVRGDIAAGSELADGGYLATVDPDQRPYDLSGR